MDQTISSAERIALLSQLTCFSNFTIDDIEQLAALLIEVSFKPNDVILEENTLVDSIYILVSGQAEVSQLVSVKRKLRKKPKIVSVPVATLYPRDTIGLNETGFFSTTGVRTATVTAHSAVTALCLPVHALKLFLEQHPHLNEAMEQSAENILRMQLIKQCLPFSPLSTERLAWLAIQVETLKVTAGTVVFHQDERADRCYLIQSGEVEVIVQESGLGARTLGVLKSPTVFGEAALLKRANRNATTRALTDCVFLVLKYDCLSELIESDSAVSRMFTTLMLDRSRPKKNPAIESYARKTSAGQAIVILKNPMNGKYFKLSPEGWFIWQQLNGRQTMQAITFALAEKFNTFEPDWIAMLILKLAKAQFIENVSVGEDNRADSPLWVRAMRRVRQVLEARFTLKNADSWIDKIYKNIGHLLFSRIGKLLLSVIAVAGLFAFIFFTQHIISAFQSLKGSEWCFLLALPLMVVPVALHELAHAMATKSYGYEVNYVGVGWFWLGPIAFTDTSDMWLGKRGPRIMVNLAGVLADTVTAGLCALCIWLVPNSFLQCLLWTVALYTYGNAFRMLSPLQELDGYYILMDVFDRPRLRFSAITWLSKGLPAALRRPRLFHKYKAEMCYWSACIIYLIFVILFTLAVQVFVFKILNLPKPSMLACLVLPLVVTILSSFGILAEIHHQK